MSTEWKAVPLIYLRTPIFSFQDHLVCFLGGTLALGTLNGLNATHLELGEAIGHGCHSMYETTTGLGPEIIYFNMLAGQGKDVTIKVSTQSVIIIFVGHYE